MKPDLPTLLPCPFCGGVPEYMDLTPRGAVYPWLCVKCLGCRISTTFGKDLTYEKAAEIWNSRTPRWRDPMENYTKRFNQNK